jgi:hypothetical protein
MQATRVLECVGFRNTHDSIWPNTTKSKVPNTGQLSNENAQPHLSSADFKPPGKSQSILDGTNKGQRQIYDAAELKTAGEVDREAEHLLKRKLKKKDGKRALLNCFLRLPSSPGIGLCIDRHHEMHEPVAPAWNISERAGIRAGRALRLVIIAWMH